MKRRRRADPKPYRVYTLRGHNYVKLGGKAWQVYGNFYSSKYRARSRLERLKWSFGGRGGRPHALFRVVKTNFGWAVVQLSSVPQYQTSAKVLTTER